MKTCRKQAALLVAACALAPAMAATPQPTSSQQTSFFPQRDLGKFLAENFDLASIRSSFGPRRTPAKRTFADFDMKPTKAGDDILEFDDETWFYQMRIMRRADINHDGIEDLEVCFTDRAKGASYNTRNGLLISRYSDETYAVALDFAVDGCDYVAKPKARPK